MIGKTLGHYSLSVLLGKGGMGEVYKTLDTKLGRDVAIKVLPAELTGDPERLRTNRVTATIVGGKVVYRRAG